MLSSTRVDCYQGHSRRFILQYTNVATGHAPFSSMIQLNLSIKSCDFLELSQNCQSLLMLLTHYSWLCKISEMSRIPPKGRPALCFCFWSDQEISQIWDHQDQTSPQICCFPFRQHTKKDGFQWERLFEDHFPRVSTFPFCSYYDTDPPLVVVTLCDPMGPTEHGTDTCAHRSCREILRESETPSVFGKNFSWQRILGF